MIKATGPDYTTYPMRRSAQMDHEFYPWRDTHAASRLTWGDNTRLGVWLQIAVEWFPLNIAGRPFLPVGAPHRPYPDTQTYTQRDYGNRVGIFRMLDALAARGMTASAFLNARVAERYPILMREVLSGGLEIVAAGLDAGAIHHDGLSEADERAMIAEARRIFAGFGVVPEIWHSPSWSQSGATPRLLLEAGFGAMADWSNDEAPYVFETGAGPIASLPTTQGLSDRDMIATHGHDIGHVTESFITAAKRVLAEAQETGQDRLITFNLSPWIMGQPYRIAAFEAILDALGAMTGLRCVTGAEVMAAATG